MKISGSLLTACRMLLIPPGNAHRYATSVNEASQPPHRGLIRRSYLVSAVRWSIPMDQALLLQNLMRSRPTRSEPAVVLAVDDEPAMLRVMARTLLEAGYVVQVATNGPEALAIAEELPNPPDLVVTDLRMDPIGGAELAQLLISRGLSSRFLFVSGYGPAAAYNEEFGPFLLKPFSPDQLIEVVEGVLSS